MLLNALIAAFGQSPINDKLANKLVQFSVQLLERFVPSASILFQNKDEKLRVNSTEWIRVIFPPYDPDDNLGKYARAKYANKTLYNIGPILMAPYSYRCVISAPPHRFPQYYRSDWADLEIARQNVMSSLDPILTLESDVRAVLGCNGFRRKATILAASVGSIPQRVHQGTRASTTINRNFGFLSATKNDFNVTFTVLQSLSKDNFLPGLTTAGLVMTRDALLGLIWQAMLDDSGVLAYGQGKLSIGMAGAVLWNTKIQGVTLKKGVVMGGGVGINHDGQLVISSGTLAIEPEFYIHQYYCQPETLYKHPDSELSETDRQFLDYGLMYYGGHGTKDGNLQIEPAKSVSPDEIFELSKAASLPLVIILDMCYSERFGERYAHLLKREKWPGIVFCANTLNMHNGEAYESEKMSDVRRPVGTVTIYESDFDDGRGVYTTAFTLALMKLRDWDAEVDEPISMSIVSFNDHLLIPICEHLHRMFDIPLQRPVIFGWT